MKNWKLWVKWPQIWDPKASLSPTWHIRYPENPYENMDLWALSWSDWDQLNWSQLFSFPKKFSYSFDGRQYHQSSRSRWACPASGQLPCYWQGTAEFYFSGMNAHRTFPSSLMHSPHALPPSLYLQLLLSVIIISQPIISFVLFSYTPLPHLSPCAFPSPCPNFFHTSPLLSVSQCTNTVTLVRWTKGQNRNNQQLSSPCLLLHLIFHTVQQCWTRSALLAPVKCLKQS